MKLDTFFEKFDKFADAPDAVAKMRELVLQFAVQGRLVTQSPDETPAAVLAVTISEDRAAFVKARCLARQREFAPVAEDQCPFTLPPGWVWTRLGNLCRVQAGFAFESASFVEGDSGVPIIRIRDITKDRTQVHYAGEYREEFLVDAGDYLVGMDGNFTIAKWRGPRALLNQRVSRLQWYSKQLEPSFFAIAAQYRLSELQGTKAYTTVDHLSSGQIENAVVPLPPLAEQKRIVTKVDELTALCDRLAVQQQKRETLHTALARASLARFADAPTSANLNFVFHNCYAISPADLRKSILTLAVQGKLIPQNPNDGDARDMINRAMEKRQKTIKTKNLRRKELDESGDLFKHENLPSSWCVERFANLVDPENTISYGVLVPGNDVPDGISFVRAQDLSLSNHPARPNKTIAPEIEKPYARTRLTGGEILLCVVGSIGKLGIVPDSWAGANIARAVARIKPISNVLRDYLLLVLQEQSVQNYFTSTTRTLAQPTLNVGMIEQTPIPVPPLPEQRRIVAKVDQLMALVDRLETQLAVSRATAANLLSALVAELTGTAGGRKVSAQSQQLTGRRGRPRNPP